MKPRWAQRPYLIEDKACLLHDMSLPLVNMMLCYYIPMFNRVVVLLLPSFITYYFYQVVM